MRQHMYAMGCGTRSHQELHRDPHDGGGTVYQRVVLLTELDARP